MRFKLTLFSLFLCTQALAANVPQAASVFTSGGAVNSATPSINVPVTSTALATRVSLIIGSSSTGSGQQHFSFSSNTQTGTGCYTPTNTLYCNAPTIAATVANTGFSLGYGTTCQYNGSAPLNAVYYSSGNANYVYDSYNTSANTAYTIPGTVRFPAGKIPFVVGSWSNAQGFSMTMDCVEF